MEEESSEGQMDTGVSSTTDDIVIVQESTVPHRDVETVITVEEVKEELVSPMKPNQHEASLTEKNQLPKSAEKSPQKDKPNIKIILKRPAKPIQLQKPIPISPVKPEETQNIVFKKVPVLPNKSVGSQNFSLPSLPALNISVEFLNQAMASVLPQQLAEVKDSSANSDTSTTTNSLILPSTDDAKAVLVTTIAEVPKNIQKTPIKNVQNAITKNTPPKTTPPKEPMLKVTTNKEQPTKIIISKDVPKQAQDKEDQVHINKVEPIKIMTTMKEQPSKSTPAKEITPQKTSNSSEKPINSNAPVKLDEDMKSISPMDLDKEASNDSQLDANSDISEKEHNRSISRELKSLINSAKESKIISECTQLTSKTRKSRTPLDTSNTSFNASVEADKIQGVRRGSDNSQKSTSSEMSDKSAFKRSMRSQNPEFVSKVKNFLNSVTGKIQKDGDMSEEEVEVSKTKNDTASSSLPKKKKVEEVVSISK